MKKKILLFILLTPYFFFSQENNLFNPIDKVANIPQSPEVAAFEKFSGSVNMYNGSPSISIPLYTLPGKEISIPVSLSYDASGVKVNQMATHVGLGWNLNYGGIISRNVHGYADDYIDDGGNHPDIKITNRMAINRLFQYGHLHGIFDSYSDAFKSYQTYINYSNNDIDLQPDTFSFSVNGLSGTILIDYSTNINGSFVPNGRFPAYCLDNPNIKVDVFYQGQSESSRHIYKFVVTDTAGNIYTFEQIETTVHTASPKGDGTGGNDEYTQHYATAWYLTNMRSANGFSNFDFVYGVNVWDNTDFEVPNKLQQISFVYNQNSNNYTPQAIKDVGYNHYLKKQVILHSITGDGYTLTTVRNSRLDLPGVERIEGFTVDYEGSFVKKINLEQSYFQTSNPSDTENYRLKLDGIKVYRDVIADAQKYNFEYFQWDDLPTFKSNGMDFWGYNNGKSGNNSLAPNMNYTYSNIANMNPLINLTTTISPNVGDRRPDFEETKKGSLISITYPTGGKTTYTYEQHKDSLGDVVGGLRLKQVTNESLDTNSGENTILDTYYLYDDLFQLYQNNIIGIPSKVADIPFNESSGRAKQKLNFSEIKGSETENGEEAQYYLLTNNRATQVPNAISYKKVTQLQFNRNLSSQSQFEGCTVTHFYDDDYENGWDIANEGKPFYQENLLLGDTEAQFIYDSNLDLLQKTNNELVNLDIINPNIPINSGIIMYPNSNNTSAVGGSRACVEILQNGNQYHYYHAVTTDGTNCVSNIPGLTTGYQHYKNTPSYGYEQHWKKLISTTTTTYEGLESLSETTNYEYTGNGHYLTTQVTTTDSKDKKSRTNIIYPLDYTPNGSTEQTLFAAMISRNQIGMPVEVVSSYESGVNTNNFDEISRQKKFFELENVEGTILPTKVQVSKGDDPLEDRIFYHSYDDYGNVTEVSYPDGMYHMYIWGYNGKHLLAEIKNARYTGISSTLLNTINNSIIAYSNGENTASEEATLRTRLNNLRNEPYFSNAQISVYVYDPGIGVKSVTDVRGYTSFYYYDQHNRLDYATDEDGNVLGKNDYNLRTN